MLPKEKIAGTSTDYNLIVEKVQNEVLLLNIVRASKRYPMYFTGFSALRGNMAYSFGSGSMTVPFGRVGTGLDGAYSIAPSVSFTNNPNFDVVVWDAKEFSSGLMAPVTMETIDYYLQQGWPREILWHLFVNRIQIAEDGKSVTLNNYPPNKAEFDKFKTYLRAIIDCRMEDEEVTENIGPKIPASRAGDLEQLIEVQKSGLKLADNQDGTYQLTSRSTLPYFNCGGSLLGAGAGPGAERGPAAKRYRLNIAKRIEGDALPAQGPGAAITIFVRSPEAILYYLGEIVRAETGKDGFTPEIGLGGCGPDSHVPLFVATTAPEARPGAAVTVDYEGVPYSIPRSDANDRCHSDGSMHVLSLISELIAQQESASTAPVTGVVTVIGGH
jgi:hypothetical protein